MKHAKIVCIFIALFSIVLFCSGCNNQEEPPTTTVAPTTQPETTTEKPTEPTTEKITDSTRENYNIGSCYNMQEDICYLIIFLNDEESSWSEKDKTSFIDNKLEPSLDFLQNKASTYDITLNNTYEAYTKEDKSDLAYNGIVEANVVNNGSQDDILKQVAKSMGYWSPRWMNLALQAKLGVRQVAYLIVVNKEGRSYKHTYAQSKIEKYEYCVFFAKSIAYDGQNCSSTIAHEILHLFGAEDYYDPYGKYPEREKLTQKLYPNDIMMEAYRNVNNAEIGAYTAYSIGWTDQMPEECNVPEWWK